MTNLLREGARVALCAALALLSACATDPPKPAPVRPVIQAAGKATLGVGDADSGAAIVLERSQELIVRLAVPVTSGADWTLVDLRPGVLRVVSGPVFQRALRNTVDDPANGSTVWRLQAGTPGSVTLDFELRRPHALGQVRSVSYQVTVR